MEKRQLLISKKIPFLKAAVLLKTSLSLFELGDEISLKFFDGKIHLGNYEECSFWEESEALEVDFAGMRYVLVQTVTNDVNELPISGSFIFSVEFKAPVNNWSFEYWGPYIDCTGVSAYYAAQLAKLDLKATTVSFRDEETGEWITLENLKEELE